MEVQKKIVAIVMAAFLPLSSAGACTLFGANGSEVEGGGTILVKNRDWRPQYQEMRYEMGPRYRFYGLYGGNEKKMALKGGVNEAGLAIFSAAASSIPKRKRMAMDHSNKSSIREILGSCATVEEALAMNRYFRGPKFLVIADAREMASVEIGDHGEYRVKKVRNGPQAHTNHYLWPDFSSLNRHVGHSSMTRLSRIEELLGRGHKPYVLDDLMAFSQDQHDGPDDSIWRTGSGARSDETLASVGLWLHDGGKPDIFVKIRYSPEDRGREDVYQLEGKDLFPGEK